MQKDIARSQIETLGLWADEWERDGLVTRASGVDEIVFLLQKTARRIAKVVGVGDAIREQSSDGGDEQPGLFQENPVSSIRGDELREG